MYAASGGFSATLFSTAAVTAGASRSRESMYGHGPCAHSTCQGEGCLGRGLDSCLTHERNKVTHEKITTHAVISQPCCLCSFSVNDHRDRQHVRGSCECVVREKMAHYSMDEKECRFWYYLHTHFVTVSHISQKVAGWLVDARLPSSSASPLCNAGLSWRGSGQRPSRRGVPDGAGLSYSSPMGCPSPTSPPRLASAVASSTSGCSDFRSRAWRD